MPGIKGLTVAVGEWYARTLEICLPRNMRHLTECLVVTTPGDAAVKAVVDAVPGARTYETEDFYANGASFNKGLAIERAFDVLGCDGYILIHDSDILMPDSLPLDRIRPDQLQGSKRRILDDPSAWTPDLDWSTLPISKDGGPIGFFQLFSADDPAVRDKRPWYDVSFAHAGGGDAFFITHWGPGMRVVLPALEVLHLGPTDTNWFGTDAAAQDKMARFVTQNGWRRAAAKFTPEQVARAGPIVERVEVPGFKKSDYELPFVKRAQQAQRRP